MAESRRVWVAAWGRLGASWGRLAPSLGGPGEALGALPGPRGGRGRLTPGLTGMPATRRELHVRPLGAPNAVPLVKIGPSEKLLFLTPPN